MRSSCSTTATRSRSCPSCRRLLRRRAPRALRRKIRHRKSARSLAGTLVRQAAVASARSSATGATSMMTKTLAAATFAASLVACVKQDDAPSEIERAHPDRRPGRRSSCPAAPPATLGQLADWYVATRDVTRTFNGGSAWVLVLDPHDRPVPGDHASTATCTRGARGATRSTPPSTSSTCATVGDGTYDVPAVGPLEDRGQRAVRGRDRRQRGSARRRAQGQRRVPHRLRRRPPRQPDRRRRRDAARSTSRTTSRRATSTSTSCRPTTTASRSTADYAYNETADGGGDMVFNVDRQRRRRPRSARTSTLRSRWQATGAGRADARIAGGDLGGAQRDRVRVLGHDVQARLLHRLGELRADRGPGRPRARSAPRTCRSPK